MIHVLHLPPSRRLAAAVLGSSVTIIAFLPRSTGSSADPLHGTTESAIRFIDKFKTEEGPLGCFLFLAIDSCHTTVLVHLGQRCQFVVIMG